MGPIFDPVRSECFVWASRRKVPQLHCKKNPSKNTFSPVLAAPCFVGPSVCFERDKNKNKTMGSQRAEPTPAVCVVTNLGRGFSTLCDIMEGQYPSLLPPDWRLCVMSPLHSCSTGCVGRLFNILQSDSFKRLSISSGCLINDFYRLFTVCSVTTWQTLTTCVFFFIDSNAAGDGTEPIAATEMQKTQGNKTINSIKKTTTNAPRVCFHDWRLPFHARLKPEGFDMLSSHFLLCRDSKDLTVEKIFRNKL